MTSLLARTPDQATTPTDGRTSVRPAEHPAPAAVPGELEPRPSTAPARPAPPAVRRLVVTGPLARTDASELEPQLDDLLRGGARTVEVDLSRVPEMDVAVARLLLRTSWRLGDATRSLVLLQPRGQVLRVLTFCGAGHLVAR